MYWKCRKITILKQKYNAHIIDADQIARNLSQKGNPYLKSISDYFGEDILTDSGELQRKKLANIIYENEEQRTALNNITFKYVVEEIKQKIAELKNEKLVVIDAPLLYESNLDKICDYVIGVVATGESKIERICKRDSIEQDIAKKRLSIQMKDEEIRKKVDYIIENNKEVKNLEEEIARLKIF